jgi:hypothetical protein
MPTTKDQSDIVTQKTNTCNKVSTMPQEFFKTAIKNTSQGKETSFFHGANCHILLSIVLLFYTENDAETFPVHYI